MRKVLALAVTVPILFALGCSTAPGVSRYREVDLGRDLDATTLARYRAETEEARQGGQSGHMLLLEQTNGWPLGLLAYWIQGTVRAMPGANGRATYMVSKSAGYGPLSAFYVSGTDAMFDADGKRLSAMEMGSVLFGHLAMLHQMGSLTPDGEWMQHNSSHWLHHLVNLSTMHGQTSWSLLSAPGAVGAGR